MVQNKTAWKHGAARAVKAIFAVLGALTIVFFAFFGGEFSTLKTLNRVEAVSYTHLHRHQLEHRALCAAVCADSHLAGL